MTAKPFFQRLRAYYVKVAEVLRGEAESAAVFPNSTDVGMSRERVYAEFLRTHVPSKCNVMFGGFVFGNDGSESGQLDVIITTDTAPQFNLHNPGNQGKTFSPVEGTLAIASIKSTLDKAELFDALSGFAAVPPTASLSNRVMPLLEIKNYDDWPYKIIYATRAISTASLYAHILEFYHLNPNVPLGRRPNVIHVAGQCCFFKLVPGMSVWDRTKNVDSAPEPGSYHPLTTEPDLQAILWILTEIQRRAAASAHILFDYGALINKLNGLPDPTPEGGPA